MKYSFLFKIKMSAPVVQFVQNSIKQNKVVIFSKSYCPYCTMAKEQFKKLNHAFTVIELDGRKDTDEVQNVLGKMTGARSVPRVFVNGHFIGGGTEVKNMYQDGTLATLLA